MDWINKVYRDEDKLKELQKEYVAAKPYPHIIINNFLSEEALEQLEEALMQESFYPKDSDLFSFAQTKQLTESKNEVIHSFVQFIEGDELSTWMHRLTNEWTTTAEADIFGALYQDTDYLLPHDDQLEDRKLAYIIYLTTLAEDEGGKLLLYTDEDGHPGKQVHAYRPTRNQLALFTVSPISWHEVEEIQGTNIRLSIGGWLHGRN